MPAEILKHDHLTLDTFTDNTEQKSLSLPDERELQHGLNAIRRFQTLVHANMIEGHDYGTIPGTQKPTLLKPGAEKIIKLFTPALIPEYEVAATEDWERPFFNYQVTCRLSLFGSDPKIFVDMGMGSCNSMESKYRWRWVWPTDLSDEEKKGLVHRTVKGGGRQYRIPNDDIYSQVNTLLKMAKKRSLVDAALSAGRLSDLFTQDIEDIPNLVLETPASTGITQEASEADLPQEWPCQKKGCLQTLQLRNGKNGEFYSHKSSDGYHNLDASKVVALMEAAQPATPTTEAPQDDRIAPPTDATAPQHIETFSQLWNLTMQLRPELKTLEDLLNFYQVNSESGLLEKYSSLDEAYKSPLSDQSDLFG
jgi:hypothetical protein